MIGENELARLLLGPAPSGYATSVVQSMWCESWDAVNNRAVIRDAFTRYTDCAVLTASLATMGVGNVLVLNQEGVRPLILGRFTNPTPAPAP